jgi:predicted dehydrogenase
MNVAIVGCGLIGRKRAAALGQRRLIACADRDLDRAAALAATHPGATPTDDWHAAATHDDVDLVIVATTHDMLAEIARVAARAGKHVLLEKPGARRAAELDPVIAAAGATGVCVRVGFNHRYHPAMQKAAALLESRVAGELLFVRGRYGHGGRLGYEREWRAVPEVSGGGELVDQGMHLIDLARWYLGDFADVHGWTERYFWDMPVEDNAFLHLRTRRGQTALLHASWTEWKNLFSLEIYGRTAKLEINGLGGSYGVERLTLYQMRPELGPPDTTSWEWPHPDASWARELDAFDEDIRQRRTPRPGLADAQAALRIVEQVYTQSRSHEGAPQ